MSDFDSAASGFEALESFFRVWPTSEVKVRENETVRIDVMG